MSLKTQSFYFWYGAIQTILSAYLMNSLSSKIVLMLLPLRRCPSYQTMMHARKSSHQRDMPRTFWNRVMSIGVRGAIWITFQLAGGLSREDGFSHGRLATIGNYLWPNDSINAMHAALWAMSNVEYAKYRSVPYILGDRVKQLTTCSFLYKVLSPKVFKPAVVAMPLSILPFTPLGPRKLLCLCRKLLCLCICKGEYRSLLCLLQRADNCCVLSARIRLIAFTHSYRLQWRQGVFAEFLGQL